MFTCLATELSSFEMISVPSKSMRHLLCPEKRVCRCQSKLTVCSLIPKIPLPNSPRIADIFSDEFKGSIGRFAKAATTAAANTVVEKVRQAGTWGTQD
jgi:hypothetical protein